MDILVQLLLDFTLLQWIHWVFPSGLPDITTECVTVWENTPNGTESKTEKQVLTKTGFLSDFNVFWHLFQKKNASLNCHGNGFTLESCLMSLPNVTWYKEADRRCKETVCLWMSKTFSSHSECPALISVCKFQNSKEDILRFHHVKGFFSSCHKYSK